MAGRTFRIAIYAATFVPNKDGVAKTLHELVKTIGESGHVMSIWSSDVPENEARSYGIHRTPSLPVFAYPAYRFGFFRPKNKRELDDFKPDLIHISTPDIAGLGFLRYGRKNGIPVSSVFHTDFPSYLRFYHIGFLGAPLWYYLRKFYNGCDIVLAPTREIMTKLGNMGIRRTDIWSRGIHLDRYNPSKRSQDFRQRLGIGDETVIMFSGRFVNYKGTDVVVSVYERMMKHHAGQVRFLMIGSGPEEARLRKSMPEAIFTGYLIGEELYRAYASSDIFLFPSTTETFGNVVLEAMASGVPCVVSDKGGCQELIKDSGGGLISRSDDANSFYDNCKKLLDRKEIHTRLREKALSFSKTRSWETINRDLLSKYEKTIMNR